MALGENAGEAIAETTQEAVQSGQGSIESLLRWVGTNQDELVIGLIVAAGIVAFMLVLRFIGSRMAARDPDYRRWGGVIGRALEKTTIFFMVAVALDIVTTYTAVPARIGRLADVIFIIAFALQGATWGRELILGLVSRRAAVTSGESGLASALSVIRVLVSVALFAIAFIVILDNLGVNVTALVAGLGIGGIAIGLAAQGIFSDLFAALAILFDRPFRRGDTIRYGTSTGTVEKIGLKTTRLRSIDGQVMVMANTKLLEQEINNFAGGDVRRTTLLFGVIYQTPPDTLEKIPAVCQKIVEDKECILIRCAITGFGASSIDFELIFDAPTTDVNVVGELKTAIVPAIMRAFAADGIEFAYPTQTTFTAAPDGRMVLPYPQVQPVVAVDGSAENG